jgi:hypothetical protein
MNRFAKILFLIIFAELSIGGGGRLFVAGPITLRMLLFGIAMMLTLYYVARGRKLSDETWQLLIFFTMMIGIGMIVGAINQAEQKFWWEDVKPLLYFFVLPFFEWVIVDQKIIRNAVEIIKISAVIQSVLFMTLLVLIHTGLIPFLDFYYFVLPTQEFFFRGEITFFYKGFLFVCIAFITVYLSKSQNNRRILLAFLLTVISITLTRGFLLAIFLTLLLYHSYSNRVRAIVFATLALCVLFFSQPAISFVSTIVHQIRVQQTGPPNEKLLGDRNYSDAGRVLQIKEVLSDISVTSFFVGHGFGIGVPSRPVHMEISYLEIFHKQGIFGLMFWGFLLWRLWKRFQAQGRSELADVLFYAAIFVFFQSLTNQFMNNPIGLSVILFSFVGLRALKD